MSGKIKPKPLVEVVDQMSTVLAETEGLTLDAAAVDDVLVRLGAVVTLDRTACVAWYRSNVKLLMATLGADAAECKSCKAPIWWIKTKAGKAAPIDADGLNHFGSCAHAKMHRKAPE